MVVPSIFCCLLACRCMQAPNTQNTFKKKSFVCTCCILSAHALKEPQPHFSVEELSFSVCIHHCAAVLLCPPKEVGDHIPHRPVGDHLVHLVPTGSQGVSEVVPHAKQLAKGHSARRLGDAKVIHPKHAHAWMDRQTRTCTHRHTLPINHRFLTSSEPFGLSLGCV